MAITAGSEILASDFVSTSAGAGDSGKVPKLDSSGRLDLTFFPPIKFGGNGADGALSVSSGNTNIDCGGARILVKNYTSISITGTGSITFTNPHANGTVVILRSQGNVTLTSSAAPMIDARSCGGTGGTGGTGTSTNHGTAGNDGSTLLYLRSRGGGTGDNGSNGGPALTSSIAASILDILLLRYHFIAPGSGGGGGSYATGSASSGTAGNGGRGAGSLIIECGGAWNFTTSGGISVAGANGTNGSVPSGGGCARGGGGGSGGMVLVLYNTLTANSGTVTTTAGTGGNNNSTNYNDSTAVWGGGGGGLMVAGSNGTQPASSGSKSGGDGAVGYSLITLNSAFP